MAISSDIEFYAIIGKAVSKAIQEVIDKCFDELQDYIERNVYAKGSGTIASGTLKSAWKHEANGLYGNLEFDPSMLAHNPSAWVHGSAYDPRPEWQDTRDIIIDIVQGGYRAYNAKVGAPVPPRRFWDEYLAYVDSKFDKWFRSALRHQGLVVV